MMNKAIIEPYQATADHTDITEVNPKQLYFNDKWNWGGFSDAKKSNWTPVTLLTIETLADLWYLLNQTINKSSYTMAKRRPERWFFRSDFVPDWDMVKNKTKSPLFQLNIIKIKKTDLVKFILFLVGETLPCVEHAIGVRIKPNQFGGEIRLWIKNKSNAYTIKQFIEREFNNPNYHYKIDAI